jgi:hydrogenase maturation protease
VTDPKRCPISSSTTVIGLGNELLTDDGLGIVALRKLAERLPDTPVTFQELSLGGLELLDHIVGFDRCIIIDAMATGKMPPGTIVRFTQTPGCQPTPISSSHQIDLNQVLALAQILRVQVPSAVAVYGIEAADITTFRQGLTPAVEQSVPTLVDAICADLNGTDPLSAIEYGRWEILNVHETED